MKRARLLHPRGVLIVTSACFVALATAVVLWGASPIDTFIRESLLNIAGPTVVSVFRVFNMGGDWRGLVPGTLLLFVVFPRARERWWLWVALMLTAPLMEWSLKQVFMRPRPENLSFSFPSGHSTAAAAFFGAVMYLCGSLPPRWRDTVRVLAGVMIVLVGLALASIASLLAERELEPAIAAAGSNLKVLR